MDSHSRSLSKGSYVTVQAPVSRLTTGFMQGSCASYFIGYSLWKKIKIARLRTGLTRETNHLLSLLTGDGTLEVVS